MNNSLLKKLFSNKWLLLSTAVIGCFLLFQFAANTLYPWRGDDFACQYQLRTCSAADLIIDSYLNWTLRLGNVVCAFIEACRTKVIFNILNSIFQTLLIFLISGTSLGRFPDIRKKNDAMLLIFISGLSVFVCRPADTVFWVPGATLYSWAAVIYLGFYLFLTHCERENKKSAAVLLMLFFWGFCAGYSNENVALAGLLFLTIRAFFKPSEKLFCSLLGFLSGAILLFTTPGALKRIASMQNGDSRLPVFEMFGKLPEIAGFYIGSSLIPLTVLFVLLCFLGTKCSKETLLRAGVAAALSVFAALVFAGCPLPPMRSYYVCSLLIMVSCGILFNGANINCKNKKTLSIISLVCGAAMLATAVPDLIAIYQDECQRKYLISEQKTKNADIIIVPEHRTLRRSFLHYCFIEDITCDKDFWLNRNAALYYEVKAIKTLPGKKTTPLFRDRFIKFIRGQK